MPDGALFRGSVNIDESSVGVASAALFAVEPDNAGNDGVSPRSVRPDGLACAFSSFEDCAGRCATTYFFCHFHAPYGGAVASSSISSDEFGS